MRYGVLMMACAALIATGCAQSVKRSDDDRRAEERQYRRLDWENRFLDYQHRCRQAGGRMVIQASSRLPRSGIPRRGDYFNCTTRIGSLPRQ